MIYIRCDASQKIGWGHLKRSLVLAEQLNKCIKTTFLIVEPSLDMCDLVKAAGSSLIKLPQGCSYQDELQFYPPEIKHIILDLGHRQTLEAPDEFVKYLDLLTEKSVDIIIIDGLDDDEFRDLRAPRVKAYIQPYWGILSSTPPLAEHWLHGADYVLLDPEYHYAYRYRPIGEINNILLTFGGSDPQENTLKVLEGLGAITSNEFRTRVVIGPSFDPKAAKKIEAFSKNHDWVGIINKPNGLKAQYEWADLCIGGSSTTRYEAASCGLPMIFTAIYKEHIKLSKSFAAFGTAKYIGFAEDLSSAHWEKEISSLLKNPKAVIKISNEIRKMKSDKPGAEQLSVELLKLFQANKV